MCTTLPGLDRSQDDFPCMRQSLEQGRCESREVWDRTLFTSIIFAYLAVFSEPLQIREGVGYVLHLP